MEYIRRIIDTELDKRLKAFNAVNIIGPKGKRFVFMAPKVPEIFKESIS